MKIICAKCKKDAQLESDFSTVTCPNCNIRMSYGDYVKYIAHNDPKYSDILSDYSGSTEGEHAGSLEDWE